MCFCKITSRGFKSKLLEAHRFEGPHGEEVRHHGGEARGEAGLGDEAELELRQADHVVPLLPVPAGDVEQVRLQQQLYSHFTATGRHFSQ